MHLNAHNNNKNGVRWAGISVKHDPIFKTTAKKCAQHNRGTLQTVVVFVLFCCKANVNIFGYYWLGSFLFLFSFRLFSIKNLSIELNLIRGLGALNNSRVAILG